MLPNEIKPVNAPKEKEIIFCISLYYGIPKQFNRQNFYFKPYLNEIAGKRNFIAKIPDNLERKVFERYLTTRKQKREISIEMTDKTTIGQYLINRNLQKLVSEIMQDYENGLLQVQEYKKPPTQRELDQKITELRHRLNLPPRKISKPLTKREINRKIKEWKKRHNFPTKDIKELE